MAVSIRGGGLVAPAIRHADQKPIRQVMAELRDLVARARELNLRSSEVSDPTITVSSLGDRGVDAVFGIIYPPQVALVGFGRISERAWSEGGRLASRPIVTVSLSGDHRVSDGQQGGLFLAQVGQLLNEPSSL